MPDKEKEPKVVLIGRRQPSGVAMGTTYVFGPMAASSAQWFADQPVMREKFPSGFEVQWLNPQSTPWEDAVSGEWEVVGRPTTYAAWVEEIEAAARDWMTDAGEGMEADPDEVRRDMARSFIDEIAAQSKTVAKLVRRHYGL